MNKTIKNLLKYFKDSALIIIFVLFNISNVFAIDDGIYIVPTTTYFVNPDTNKIDDKGTDKALGEAMARSTIYENALLEVKKGKIYLTIRIKFVSNISNVKISVQNSKGGGYSTVKSKLISENDVKNYADYRFHIKKPNLNTGVEFYFKPMGREVKFYLSVDETKATSGNENFITSIKIDDKKEKAKNKKEKPKNEESSAKKTDKLYDSRSSDSSKKATKDKKENGTKKDASAENMTEKEMESIDRIVEKVTLNENGQASFGDDEEQTPEYDTEQEEETEQDEEETDEAEGKDVEHKKTKETLEEVPTKAKISTSSSGTKNLKRLKKSKNSSVITLVTFGALFLGFIGSIIYISRK